MFLVTARFAFPRRMFPVGKTSPGRVPGGKRRQEKHPPEAAPAKKISALKKKIRTQKKIRTKISALKKRKHLTLPYLTYNNTTNTTTGSTSADKTNNNATALPNAPYIYGKTLYPTARRRRRQAAISRRPRPCVPPAAAPPILRPLGRDLPLRRRTGLFLERNRKRIRQRNPRGGPEPETETHAQRQPHQPQRLLRRHPLERLRRRRRLLGRLRKHIITPLSKRIPL